MSRRFVIPRAVSCVAALAAGLAATQALASCADSEPPTKAALEDAGPVPDSSVVVEVPDADAGPPCGPGAWCAIDVPPPPVSLNGVWGSGPDDVWIVGSPDLTLHWDGKAFATAKADTKRTMFGVWGSGKGDVWAFSSGDAMWHASGFGDGGAVWSAFDGADGGGWPGPIAAMTGTGPGDVWAVGPFQPSIGAPPVWHCDGWRDGAPDWQFATTHMTDPPEPEPISFNGAWTSATEVWIVGMGGKTRVGTSAGGAMTWTPVNSATSMDLYAVWGDASGVWAAGAGGTMRRFSRGATNAYVAEEIALPTTATITAIAGTAADDVWAVGSGGTILHWDGKAWSIDDAAIPDAGDRDLYAVWASSKDDVWVVGRETLLHKGTAALPRSTP